MAGKVIGLGIILDLIDKASGPAGRIARRFRETTATAREMGAEVRNVGLAMTATGAALTYANAKIIGSTFDSQRALGELASLGIKDLQAIEDKAVQVSNTWGRVTKPQFITAAYDIKSAISNLSDSAVADFTEWTAITSKATKGNVEQMSDLFATGYGIYKELFPDISDSRFAEVFSDVIATTVQRFKMTGPKVGEYISLLGASATKQNVPLAEQMAIAGMLGTTMSGSEAATKYGAFLKQPVKAAEKLGLNFTNARNQLLPMADILDKIRGKFGKDLDAVEKGLLMEAFGRIEGVKLVEILYDKTAQLRQETQILQDAMGKGGQVARDMANEVNQMPGDQWEVFKQQVHNLTEMMGKAVLPLFMRFVARGKEFALWAQKFITAHPGFVKLLMTISSLAGVALVAGGIILTFSGTFLIAFHSIDKLIIALKGLNFILFSIKYYTVIAGGAIKLLFATATKAVWAFMTTNPIGWVLLAISAIVMFALAWKNNWLGIGDFMNKLVAEIALRFLWLWNHIASFVKSIASLPGKFYDAGKNIVLSIWEGIKSVANWPVRKVKEIVQNIRDLLPFSPAKEGPLVTLDKAGLGIVEQIRGGLNRAKPQLKDAVTELFREAQFPMADATYTPFSFFWKGFNIKMGPKAIFPLPGETTIPTPGKRNTEGGDSGSLDIGQASNLPGGGSGTMGSGNVYLTQHFERGSIVLDVDRLDDEKLRRLMGRIFREEMAK